MSSVPRSSLFLLLALPACGDPDDTGSPSSPPPSCVSSIAVVEENPFAASLLVTCDRDLSIEARFGPGDARDRVTPAVAASADQQVEILLLGLHAATGHGVDLVASDGEERWTLDAGTATAGDPPGQWGGCTATSAWPDDTWTQDEVVCTAGGSDEASRGFYCLDRAGLPVWIAGDPDGADLNVLTPLQDGTFAATGTLESTLWFLDAAGRLTSTWRSFEITGTRYTHEFINGHDLIQIQDGAWAGALAVMTGSHETRARGDSLVGSGIVVLDPVTREILWDWNILGDLTDGVPIDPRLVCAEDEPRCLNANAILHRVDDEGRESFWLEIFDRDQIVQVDVATGAVDWILGVGGEFRLVDDLDAPEPLDAPPSDWMFKPHAPKWVERSGSRIRFIVHDNGVDRADADGVGYSRLVEYEIDEARRLARVAWSYGSPDPEDPSHFFAEAGGDVLLSPDGDSLLFARNGEDTRIEDLALPEEEERWRLVCDDMDAVYRIHWFPSLYDTTPGVGR